jgi:hypothetical protein
MKRRPVNLEVEYKLSKGGLLKQLAKAIAKELPEASASQKTQIPGTEPTYRKAKEILDKEKPEGRTLDYGSGLGIGSRVLGAESFEPFPRAGVQPTFIRPEDIPSEAFDRLVNLNMLNVVPRDVRDAAVENIGRVMRPGGTGIITTRGKDVMKASGELGPEPNSIITSIGTYQKGFSPEELREYLEYMLGREYEIRRLGLGPAGAMIKKKADGGEVSMAGGGLLKKVLQVAKQAKPAAERQENLRKFLEGSDVKDRMFHGTTKNFKKFKTSPEREMGAHFGTPSQANAFATKLGGRTVPAYLNIKKPYEAQMDLGTWDDVDTWKDYLYNWEHGGNGPINPSDKEIEALKTANDVRELLESRGFDGIKYFNQIEGTFDDLDDGQNPENLAYIIFRPEQAKSAIGNVGSFDATNPDILKSAGGAVTMKRGGRAKSDTFAAADTGKVEMKAPQVGKGGEALLSAAEAVVPFVGATKSALEGEYQKALMEAGLDVAGGPIAKGLGAAAPMLAGIFIGPNAKTWSKRAAKEFEKLEKAGVSNEEAFKKTGTFRSPDGSLRQEISDKPSALRRERMQSLDEEIAVVRGRASMEADKLRQAFKDGKLTKEQAQAEWDRIRPDLNAEVDALEKQKRSAGRLAMTNRAAPLGKTLYHPEAFKAYPDLRDLRARYSIEPDQYPEGYLARMRGQQRWTKDEPWDLYAQGKTTPEARSIMLHEMQHGIQELENFGRGSNAALSVSDMLPPGMTENDYLQQLRASMGRMEDEQKAIRDILGPTSAEDFNINSPRFPQVANHLKLTEDIEGTRKAIEDIIGGGTYPAYRRSAGEAEARAVQKRMPYSEDTLRELFPLSSYDVPLDQLIVKRGYAEGGEVEDKPKRYETGQAVKDIVRGGLSNLESLVRGSAAGLVGLPGDINEIIRDLIGYNPFPDAPALPSTETILKAVPRISEARPETEGFETAGQFVQAPKQVAQTVTKAAKAAAPATKEMLEQAFQKAQESGMLAGPAYAVKPTGGQWLGGYKGNPRQIDVRNAPTATSPEALQSYQDRLEDAQRAAKEYTEMTGMEPTQTMTDRVRGMQMDVNRLEQEEAVRRWVDSNLNNYVRKQMGTPDDPVRKLADEGVLHMPYQDVGLMQQTLDQRKAAGFPEEGFATTDLGRMWETLTDSSIKQIEAGKLADPEYMLNIGRKYENENKNFGRPGAIPESELLTPQQAREVRNFPFATHKIARDSMMENNPWLAKVDPSTPIYGLAPSRGDGPANIERALGLDHIVDVLKEDLAAGRLRPEQLSKMSMEQAVRRTAAYDAERAAAMAKATAEDMKNLTVAQEFDDGYKMVQLDKPGQFAKESDRMGHSVRGYEPREGSEDWIEAAGNSGYSGYGHGGWDAIKGGEAQVFSLRDAKNNPHVTIEVGKPDLHPRDWLFNLPEEQATNILAQMPTGASLDNTANFVRNLPEFQEARKAQLGVITQIKGKQNAAPNEDYLPMIQKFIRDGNYVVSGDLRNADMVDTTSPNFSYLREKGDLPNNVPRYVTMSEWERLQRTGEFTPDPHLAPTKKKAGGAVIMKTGGKVKPDYKSAMEMMFHAYTTPGIKLA